MVLNGQIDQHARLKNCDCPVWANGHDPEFPLGLAKSVLIVREGDSTP